MKRLTSEKHEVTFPKSLTLLLWLSRPLTTWIPGTVRLTGAGSNRVHSRFEHFPLSFWECSCGGGYVITSNPQIDSLERINGMNLVSLPWWNLPNFAEPTKASSRFSLNGSLRHKSLLATTSEVAQTERTGSPDPSLFSKMITQAIQGRIYCYYTNF